MIRALIVLIAVLSLTAATHAQSRWGFVSWQSDVPLSSAWHVEIERATPGIIASDDDAAPTVVVVNFTSEGCWTVRLYDGDRLVQEWQDKERCYRIYAPLLGRLWLERRGILTED